MKNKHQLKPTVSVRFMVYNNEPYIREAIEGILIQQTNFLVEIVVGDDFSTDNTLNIIKEYKDTSNIYFNILQREVGGKYWKDRKRLGRLYNFRNIVENCSGKYIALLEGDDYWTDPLKLQKQVDFLEKNPDYNICFHRASLLQQNIFSLHQIPSPFESESFNYIQLLRHYNFITTASVVIRKHVNLKLPRWFTNIPFGDLALYQIVSKNKKIKCIADTMSVYRIHNEGIYSKLNSYQKMVQYLHFYSNILSFLDKEEKIIVKLKGKIILNDICKSKFPKSLLKQKMYFYALTLKYL
jgi:glycosyltransferase involved in cell wall biosynthesis